MRRSQYTIQMLCESYNEIKMLLYDGSSKFNVANWSQAISSRVALVYLEIDVHTLSLHTSFQYEATINTVLRTSHISIMSVLDNIWTYIIYHCK